MAEEPKTLRIAVASNFTPALKKLLPEFERQTGIKSQILSAATGTLFLQIKHGAPFDILLSADARRPKQLEHDELTVLGSRKTYALGQLALFSHGEITHLKQLNNVNSTIRIAIANPDTAPYGKAAKETLQHLNLWVRFNQNLVTGINVSQTFNQVRSKAVGIGLVANSQLVLNELTGLIIPNELHQPIKQQIVILKRSKNKSAAQLFSHFILSEPSQKIIQQLGYSHLPSPQFQLPREKLAL
jgi:molybdate transport system substrate-binding protein